MLNYLKCGSKIILESDNIATFNFIVPQNIYSEIEAEIRITSDFNPRNQSQSLTSKGALNESD